MLNKDPYEILEINKNASQEEIRSAYRKLVKKYHPDKYQGNPLADLAEEKLQEINEAYDFLTKNGAAPQNAGGGFYDSNSSYGYESSYSSGSAGGSSQPLYNQIRAALNRRDVYTAEQLLINAPSRDAEWFFLSGVLSAQKGYIADGLANIRKATDMDPGNTEYREAYAQMQRFGSMFTGDSDSRGYQPNDALCLCLPFLPCLCC